MFNLITRLFYRAAHVVLRAVWFVTRPETTGALVAVWCGGKVLLVRNSYRRALSLPGGYVQRDEERRMTAARELQEEVGITVLPHNLKHAYHGTHIVESRRDTLDIFEIELERLPDITIDRREVLRADFMSPAQALARNIVPHVDEYLSKKTLPRQGSEGPDVSGESA